MKKSLLKAMYDFSGIPLRLVLLPDAVNEKLGLTSLQQERLYNVLPYVEGTLLDIGCGNNRLVKIYGDGVGVDIYDWGGGATIIESVYNLPFGSESFDTVTVIASLNHIPEREKAVREINRVLKMNGNVIVTMINPLIGHVGHKIWWYSEDKKRGMEQGETYGLWNKDVVELFKKSGFELKLHKSFLYWMNNLFVFRKNSDYAKGTS